MFPCGLIFHAWQFLIYSVSEEDSCVPVSQSERVTDANRSVGFLSERLLWTAGCLVGCLHEFHVARSRQEMCVSHSACPHASAGNNATFHLYRTTITLRGTQQFQKQNVSYSWCTCFFRNKRQMQINKSKKVRIVKYINDLKESTTFVDVKLFLVHYLCNIICIRWLFLGYFWFCVVDH